ncbi:hypothetical protein TSAR_015835 [Trichomalopsis sarcophagae]|uniref:Uncharacterized protein n=1 Tax=Trichomalopsis sarcophagae TaxID=543379 RepID=A0A232FCX8_9HYME|nr:hypothetical protein TSAR_015835 [Trichomalopsis sarcophagae]
MLVELEFDPKHISLGYTDEAYGGKVECFVSKGQGTKYYNLLHSELKQDVRLFIEMVEPKIDVPVKSFLQILKKPDEVLSQISLENKLKRLINLKSAAKGCIKSYKVYFPMLQGMSKPYDSEKNVSPWKTLKEGSYYLGDVYRFIEYYKNCSYGLIDDVNIQSINNFLVELEFDPKHISSGYTDEAYGGKANCFVSKGQGTKYYNILHSELKKDVRSFIELVDLKIDIPLKNFTKMLNKSIIDLQINSGVEGLKL